MIHSFQLTRRNVYSARSFVEGLRFVFGGLLFCAILIGAACEKAPPKPVSISKNDVCFYCKSPIADTAFAAAFVTKDGFIRKFDDISCFIANAKKVGKKNIKAFYAMDALSRTSYPAEQLQYVRSIRLQTPQKGGIIAIQDAAKAQGIAGRYQGEVVRFDELIK
jgi:nitrous oxide reductase accessory protein NosL